jgi:cyclopropane fatty-acyl-phospholipid synthase-like methyltransferase
LEHANSMLWLTNRPRPPKPLMPNPVIDLIEKHAGPDFLPNLKLKAQGMMEDFWKDPPCTFPRIEVKIGTFGFSIPNWFKPIPLELTNAPVVASAPAAPKPPPPPPPIWHAKPGEVAEKMWGEGQILPAGEEILEMLTAPLKLAKEKVVLDLTAGLGGPLRKLSIKILQVKGLEADPQIAARAMELAAAVGKAKIAPISTYDTATFSMPSIYDAMIARELFYRIPDRAKLFYSISAGIKFGGQVGFSDFIVDPENRPKPAIKAWIAHETGANPLGLIDMAQAWAAVGFELRASEDQTAFYKKAVAQGLGHMVKSLRANGRPDPETQKAILAEVQTWVHRMAAMEQGMKFYRFHAVKS